MSLVTGIIKLFFGTKAEKDRKEIQPYVDKIQAVYPEIDRLSNDELRALSEQLKREIREYIQADEEKVAELKKQMEDTTVSIDDKERTGKELDKLEKEIDEKIEKSCWKSCRRLSRS